jgi:hypothetical protein
MTEMKGRDCARQWGIQEEMFHIKFMTYLYFLLVLELELRALDLLGRHSTCFSHVASPFYCGYFWDKVFLFARTAWAVILLLYVSYHSWDDRHMPPCQAFSHWDGGPANFFTQTVLEPALISASQVARIIGMSHWCLADWSTFERLM